MNRLKKNRWIAAGLLGLSLAELPLAVAVRTLDTRGLIEQALNEKTFITLENVKLADAVSRLSEQTGVKIFIAPSVMDLVPNGPDTVIHKVQIANIPLREGLTRLFSPLGMTFVVNQDHLEVIPKEALLSLGRAPTWKELETLAELSTLQIGLDRQGFERWRDRFQFRLPGVMPFWDQLLSGVSSVGAGPGDQVLTIACENLGWSWCLNDSQVVVTTREEHIRRLLHRPISLKSRNRPVGDVLAEIAEKGRVRIAIEAGGQTPPRALSLNVQNRPIEEVLENVASSTGLAYYIDREGVNFINPTAAASRVTPSDATRPASACAADPYVGKIVVTLEGGKSMEWLVRWSELPPDLQERRERDLAEAFEAMRHRLGSSRP